MFSTLNPLTLAEALQLDSPTGSAAHHPARVTFVGAGGKTTALYQLAHQLPPPVIVTTTTHLASDQLSLGDAAAGLTELGQVEPLFNHLSGVTTVYGELIPGGRVSGPSPEILEAVYRYAEAAQSPVSILVEGDGSRRLPLKAPAAHEPVIPNWTRTVVVVAGLSALGKPLTPDWVHRPELFASLAGLEGTPPGEPVTIEAIARVLAHPEGGMKGVTAGASLVALLNQADTAPLQAAGGRLADLLLRSTPGSPDEGAALAKGYERVIIASLGLASNPAPSSGALSRLDSPGRPAGAIFAVRRRVAGILLAAGESSRLGRPKQLLSWRGEPFVRQAARAGLAAGLDPLVAVTGASRGEVEAALSGLPVNLAYNPDWAKGQSTSLQAGLRALPGGIGAAVFLLSDQPQVTPPLIQTMLETHFNTLAKLVAPEVDGQRANPVLFDRATFGDLLGLSGDAGGRAVFSKYPMVRFPWHDASLLLDVDTEEDYQRLLTYE